MGLVYKAFDPDIERHVALKTIRSAILTHEEHQNLLTRLKQEARAAGRIQHPNIVAIYEYGEAKDGLAFLAMEFVEGKSFAESLKERNEPLSVKEALSVMELILAALEYAHMRGVVHRDVKPDNIMLLDNGDVKVTDFGIAHLDTSTLTHTGAILGTPCYMAPEMFSEFETTPSIDIYAAGILLYEMLTLKKPFSGSVAGVIKQILTEEPSNPANLNPEISDALGKEILKAISKDPEQRHRSAQDFAVALKYAFENPDGGEKSSQSETAIKKRAYVNYIAPEKETRLQELAKDCDFRRVSIVLAHADSRIRKSAADILYNNGFREIKVAKSIAEARDLLRHYKPQLFVCGSTFPDGDSQPLISSLRHGTLGLNPFIIITVLTSDPSSLTIQRLVSSGADDILTLPLSTVQFLDRVINLISRRKQFVVTSDYIGPDRRTKTRPDPNDTPLMDVPNPLQAIAKNTATDMEIYHQTKEILKDINYQKLRQHAWKSAWLADKAAKLLQSDQTDPQARNYLKQILSIQEDVVARQDKKMPVSLHIQEFSRSLGDIIQKILSTPPNKPLSPKDLMLVKPLCQAMNALFEEGKTSSGTDDSEDTRIYR